MARYVSPLVSLRRSIGKHCVRQHAKRRQHHLRQLAWGMRRKLAAAYPQGFDPACASLLLSDGDQMVRALKCYEAGTYGYCTDCRQPIPLLELWAQPHRLTCRACLEQRGEPPARSIRFVI